MTEQQLFLAACLDAELWAFIERHATAQKVSARRHGAGGHYDDAVKAAGQPHDEPKAILHGVFHALQSRGAWHPGSVCRYCQKPVTAEDIAITHGYRLGNPAGDWYPSHKGCKADGELREVDFRTANQTHT